MIDLPDYHFDPDDTARMADWVELNSITGGYELSKEDISDLLHNSLLPESVTGEGPQARAAFVAEEVLREVRSRAGRLAGYPLQVLRTAECSGKPWSECLCFTALLLADLGRDYRSLKEQVSLAPFPRYFEKVTQACLASVLGGTSIRFGTPIEPDWPKPISERIRYLADKLDLEPLGADVDTEPYDNDLGLDVVTRASLGDERPGTYFVLAQCATGRKWEAKRGEPSLDIWLPMISWGAPLVRAIAVPWRWNEDERRLARVSKLFGSMVLDRLRLLSGRDPDMYLDLSARSEIENWCEECLAKLPREY